MNDELRQAFARLDKALAEARAAMEPEPRCPNCGSTRKFRQDDKGRWLCDHCGYLAPAPQPEAVLDYSGPLPSNMCPNCEDIMQWDLLSDGSWRCPACEYVLRAVDADIQPEPTTEPEPEPEPPCVEEPEPRGVVVQCGGRDIRLATIDEIGAGVCPGAGPRLYVKLGSCLSWTTTPIDDIIAQAAVPNIELPNVTVKCSGWTWTRIDMVTVEARSNDTLDTTIVGVSDSGTGKEFPLSSARTTPAHVCKLCELAGWPRPEVRCEFHHCDGTACEVDPARVTSVRTFRTTATRETRVWMGDDDWLVVREPVPVVQRMIDACKEDE